MGSQIKEQDIETAAQAITAVSFIYGFVRPAILGHKRSLAQKQVLNITALLSRALHCPELVPQTRE